MNQILFSGEVKKQTDIKSILKFLGIIIIIFGIILAFSGIYNLVKNAKNNNNNPGLIVPENTKPEVSIEKEDDFAIIKITHDKGIQNLKYNWNDEEENIIECDNKSSVTEKVEMLIGDNTLYVTVIDEIGEKVTYQKQFLIGEDGSIINDKDGPIIELPVVQGTKFKIIVKDESEIKEILYVWKDQEEVNVPIGDDKHNVEFLTEIPAGKSSIKIIAKDKYGNETTREEEVIGVTKPKITVVQDGDSIIIRAEDQVEMASLEFTLNGKNTKLVYPYDTKVMEWKKPLKEGFNRVSVIAINIEGTMSEFEGKVTYVIENAIVE